MVKNGNSKTEASKNSKKPNDKPTSATELVVNPESDLKASSSAKTTNEEPELKKDSIVKKKNVLKKKTDKKRVKFGEVELRRFEIIPGAVTVPSDQIPVTIGMGDEIKEEAVTLTLEEFERAKKEENKIKWNIWTREVLKDIFEEEKKREMGKKRRKKGKKKGKGKKQKKNQQANDNEENTDESTSIDEAELTQFIETNLANENNDVGGSSNENNGANSGGSEFEYSCQLSEYFRRILLKRNVSKEELEENQKIEEETKKIIRSREKVGCSCPRGRCQPQTCECAVNGIECLFNCVDGGRNKPCPCAPRNGAKGCQNPVGRRAFDPDSVQAHFLRTIQRIKTGGENGSPQLIKFDKETGRFEVTTFSDEKLIIDPKGVLTRNQRRLLAKVEQKENQNGAAKNEKEENVITSQKVPVEFPSTSAAVNETADNIDGKQPENEDKTPERKEGQLLEEKMLPKDSPFVTMRQKRKRLSIISEQK